MRVISGSARGQQLSTFSGLSIRPTPDRVKEALFSILNNVCGSFEGLRILDIFSGSGALGIEALSRGAVRACFVDQSLQAINLIRKNVERCRLNDRSEVIMADVWSILPRLCQSGPFDLVFADPPYRCGFASRLLREGDWRNLLTEEGVLCLETESKDLLSGLESEQLQQVDKRRYGTTMLHIFQLSTQELA